MSISYLEVKENYKDMKGEVKALRKLIEMKEKLIRDMQKDIEYLEQQNHELKMIDYYRSEFFKEKMKELKEKENGN